MNKQRKIIDLMFRYFELQDRINTLQTERDKIRLQLLGITDPGQYGPGTVYRVAKTKIEVKGYTRSGFKGIRRHSSKVDRS